MKTLLVKSFSLTTIVMATIITAVSCQEKTERPVSGLDYSNIDTTALPGDDFYRFATGHWIDNNPQNPEYSRWGAFTKLDDDNKKQLQEMFLELLNVNRHLNDDEQKVADLFTLAMDSTRRNALGATPLQPYLDEIDSVQTREEFVNLMAHNHDNLLFGIGIAADEKNSTMNIVNIYQGGLGLGDESYYLQHTDQNKKIRIAYREYCMTIMQLAGMSEEDADSAFNMVYSIEHDMATVTVPRVERRDPEKNYHKMSIAELNDTLGYDFGRYLVNYGYEGVDSVNLCQIAPLQKACAMLRSLPLKNLKALYRLQTIKGCAGLMSDDFVEAAHKFNCVMQGETELQPRWKRAIGLVNGTMGEIVGKMYVTKYFPEEAKQRMLHLVDNLRLSLGERIDAQEWMSEETKAVAHDKLDAVIVKIGYPDKWEDYSGLYIDPAKNLVDNMYAAMEFFFALDKEKHLGKPVDNTEWFMNAHTVNAYYNTTTNEICFPAGILQPPFFNMEADDATNLGAIGVVIGHEMTHGFDDQGRQYDKTGNLRQWWSDADIEAFKKPAEQLTEYFNNLEVLPAKDGTPALMANGRQCLGENLADHGGVMVALNALQHIMETTPMNDDNGYTPLQRFFLSYANVWAGIINDETIRYLTVMDVHSISRLRVNGTLPHIDAWYDAFGVKEGDAMYLPKEKRVKIW